ncbi:MAG: metallophosphoesterase family protein [Desulfobacterales bacterium]|nr:metallophosphoesterase family protein [Desulfobacterales bacterium]
MLIYAVADIHGRKNRISSIHDIISSNKPDLLVLAGDVNSLFNSSNIMSYFSNAHLPILVVRGNTDSKKIANLSPVSSNISFLHFSEIVINGFSFTGVSGTIPVPFSSRIQFREKQTTKKLEPLVRKDTILIAHPPPFGTLDKVLGKFHAGCKSLREIISRRQPQLLICGHIHEMPGSAFLGKTLVVNCSIGMKGKGALIELNTDRPPVVEMV